MIAFNKYYNQFNILSISLVVISLFLLTFKGLNFGIDFKGGTLIELRSTDSKINVSSLRDNLNSMNLGDVSVKNFGNETDFLIKFEINLSIIAAVLTIVGYSMNDTVVIFDRVRENLRKYSDIKIYDLTNISINETLSRTLITSITTLLALLSIFFFGGEILKGFSLAMIFGVIFGTYSSIYIANTVLVRLRVSQKTVLREDESN